jgi:hypothetical protein
VVHSHDRCLSNPLFMGYTSALATAADVKRSASFHLYRWTRSARVTRLGPRSWITISVEEQKRNVH